MILVAYDSIGVPRTIDQRKGLVEFLVAPDFADDAICLLRSLSEEIVGMCILNSCRGQSNL